MRNRFNKNDKFEYYPAINKYTEITIKVGKKPGTECQLPGLPSLGYRLSIGQGLTILAKLNDESNMAMRKTTEKEGDFLLNLIVNWIKIVGK